MGNSSRVTFHVQIRAIRYLSCSASGFSSDRKTEWPVPEKMSQRDYVGIASESGYPACSDMSLAETKRYLQGVVGTALQYDITAAGRKRGGEQFRQAMLGFLRSFALHSGRIT